MDDRVNSRLEMGDAVIYERVSYGLISKGNGEAILSKERHMSISCGGGQAGQGYPAVMICNVQMDERVIGVDQQGSIPIAVERNNSKASITTDATSPTIMGIRGAHQDVPLMCWAVDSHPMDSRIEIMEGACPTIAAHIAKAGCDGPLVLMKTE